MTWLFGVTDICFFFNVGIVNIKSFHVALLFVVLLVHITSITCLLFWAFTGARRFKLTVIREFA